MLKPIVRVSSFLGKEIREILRQPWLVVRLILGPFLILLLVGLGYTSQARRDARDLCRARERAAGGATGRAVRKQSRPAA